MTYAVTMLRLAQKQLAKLDAQTRSRIASAIHALAENPRLQEADRPPSMAHPGWHVSCYL